MTLFDKVVVPAEVMARQIGEERAGWYYRRLKPTGAVVKGPYKTLAAAVKAAPNRK